MAFNPKAKKLELIPNKDVNKKSIDKLGIKHNAKTGKKAPCFIKLEHTFPDKTVGPLFIFGKFDAAVKKEIKDALTGDLSKILKGFAHVEADEKGKTTLVISPSKGKLQNKPAELTKAMKAAFTTAYADFKIGSEIDDKAAAALEAATDAEPDDVEDAPNTVESAKDLIDKAQEKVDATAKPGADAAKTDAQVNTMTKVIAHVTGLMETLKKLQAEKADQAQLTAAATAVEKALIGAQTGKIV
jgi:hypothetical protein